MTTISKTPSSILKFRFVGLKDLSFYFADEDYALPKLETDIDNFNINIDTDAELSPTTKFVTYKIAVTYFFESSDADEAPAILIYSSKTTFYVDNFDEVFLPLSNGSFKSNKKISRMLIGIALSTIRGVIIAKTANSYLSRYPLPIISSDLLNRIEGDDQGDENT